MSKMNRTSCFLEGRRAVIVVFLCSLFFSFLIFCHDDTYALDKHDYVKKITSFGVKTWCGDHNNGAGKTLFNVGVKWGDLCKDGACSFTSSFSCQNAGLACATTSNVTGFSVTKKKTTKKYVYYRLYVRTDSGYQDAAATFRRKISNDADLTLYAYDKTFGRWMFDGEPQDYNDSGTKDTVWAGSDVFDEAPYEIDLWSTDEPIRCPGGTVGSNDWNTAYSCTVKNAKDDVEATSYYRTYPIYVTVYGLIQGTNTYVRTVKDLQYKRPRLADYKRSYGGYDDEAYEQAEHDYSWCRNNEEYFIHHSIDGYERLRHVDWSLQHQYEDHQCASFEEEVDIPARIAGIGSAYYGRSATTGSVPDTIVAMDGKEYYFNGWSNCNDTYVVNGDKQVAYHNDAKRTCTVGPIERDTTVYALYGQKQIAGRAVASSGSVSADTGYVGENTTKDDTNIDCNNDGCNVAFKVYLKAVRGSGTTPFSTDTNSTVSSPFTPSAEGNEVGNVSQVLKPGENACKSITFHPFGQYDENVTKTAKSCLTAKVTNFTGRISVIGADPGTNDSGWSNSNKQVNTYVDNCSPVTGCKVSFKHEMEQTNSIGSTDYTIKRTSNLTDAAVGGRAISANDNLANGEFGGSIGTRTVKEDNNLTLYPGMKVCESLTFKPNNSHTNPADNVTVTTCVHANGNAQPPDPPNPTTEEPPSSSFTGDGAFVNIKVRNASVAKYNNYQQTVFAKPGDNVEYRASYNPILQYTYFLKPDKMRIDNGDLYVGNGSILGKLFNDNKKTLGIPDWNNGFSILMGESSQLSYHRYDVGLTKLQSPDPNTVAIKPGDVGQEIKERAKTSYESEIKVRTTPSQVSFDDKQNSVGQVITQSIYRDALAKVPYNFELKTEVTTPDTEPVFAGGEFSFNYDLIVKERTNITLDGTYATRVDNPKVKIGISYYGDKGDIGKYIWSKEKSMDSLNKDNALHNPPVTKGPAITINIPDLNAGERICIRSAVFPIDSHHDTSMNPATDYDPNDPKAWQYSEPVCYYIAKRPSIQVWGGNVFSGGTISAPRSVKNNLYEYNEYAVQSSTGTHTFGSWGELGVISRGEVRGFASGATLGYVSNDGSGNLNPVPYKYLLDSAPNTRARVGDKPGGSDKNDFCWHSLLTIANNNCSGGVASGTGDTDATDGIKLDKDALEALTKNAITEQGIPGNKIKLDDAINEVLYSTNGDVEVQGGTLRKHAFKIVSSKDGNVTITGNIQIEESETFEKFSHSPKAVIYAENTIFIDCSVSRIDALLVARRVVTCKNFGGDGNFSNGNIKASINDESNSNQLIVNGAIVANKLYANRTYGAAKGANSMVPAEIINFDPVLYLWGGVAGEKKTDDDDDKKVINGNMEMTFVHEIAPRY